MRKLRRSAEGGQEDRNVRGQIQEGLKKGTNLLGGSIAETCLDRNDEKRTEEEAKEKEESMRRSRREKRGESRIRLHSLQSWRCRAEICVPTQMDECRRTRKEEAQSREEGVGRVWIADRKQR